MKNMVKKMAALVALALLAFAAPAFAESGGGVWETNVKEERAILGDWVAPRANGNPLFGFYKNRAGFAHLRADKEAWTHFQFIYDPKKSEYQINDMSDGSRLGTARLIRTKGKPDTLAVKGQFIDHADRVVKFEYSLVRSGKGK
jgi:hypothetical protein